MAEKIIQKLPKYVVQWMDTDHIIIKFCNPKIKEDPKSLGWEWEEEKFHIKYQKPG